MKTSSPAVQVVCITYKHEKFLAEALESFVRQKTNFPFEVLVGNDCSPDGTQTVIDTYVQKYPHIVKDIKRERNMGPTRNLVDLCKRCTAPYIAFCEGDDYWVDDCKLQKQYDYMESHPEAKFCFTRTKITFPEGWGIEDYYTPINGEILMPDSMPGAVIKDSYRVHEMIDVMPAQTSSFFFRWNYNIEIPEWYYGGILGDNPMLYMQLGEGVAGFIPDVTSVYRRSEVGVFMTADKTEHFLKTRKEYIRFLYGCMEYFREHHNSYACPQMLARLVREVCNLMDACNTIGRYDELIYALQQYPESMKEALTVILGNSQPSQKRAKKKRGWFKRNFLDRLLFDKEFYLMENKDVAKSGMNPRRHYFAFGWKEGRRAYPANRKVFRLIKSWLWYWLGALVPKKKNSWVFSSFFQRGYMDNTKYLYEYLVENHPEIQVTWLTMDDKVYKMLKEKGMPVKKMKKAKWTMLRAAVAFTDHFRSSDYDNVYGFNARTKVVQLWHGVGLKNMVPVGDSIPNTTVPGVRLSSDIVANESDGLFARMAKSVRYIFRAPFRELTERYFGFVCPGPAYESLYAKGWHMPKDCCIFAGYPRNVHLHKSQVPQKVKVIYSPTYRWDPKEETKMIDDFIAALPLISQFLDSVDGEMSLRLHPHTWRSYMSKIKQALQFHPRVGVDEEKDAYEKLGEYSHMVGDFSSISNDFAELMNRPHVFLVPDLEAFLKNDCALNNPFEEYSPGAQVKSWPEVIDALKEYIENPKKDEEWRLKIQEFFFDMKVNDENNSQRIVEEIKRRLKIS